MLILRCIRGFTFGGVMRDLLNRSSAEQNSSPALNSVTNKNVTIHMLRASDEVENIDVAVEDYLAQLGENFMDLTILGLRS